MCASRGGRFILLTSRAGSRETGRKREKVKERPSEEKEEQQRRAELFVSRRGCARAKYEIVTHSSHRDFEPLMTLIDTDLRTSRHRSGVSHTLVRTRDTRGKEGKGRGGIERSEWISFWSYFFVSNSKYVSDSRVGTTFRLKDTELVIERAYALNLVSPTLNLTNFGD